MSFKKFLAPILIGTLLVGCASEEVNITSGEELMEQITDIHIVDVFQFANIGGNYYLEYRGNFIDLKTNEDNFNHEIDVASANMSQGMHNGYFVVVNDTMYMCSCAFDNREVIKLSDEQADNIYMKHQFKTYTIDKVVEY